MMSAEMGDWIGGKLFDASGTHIDLTSITINWTCAHRPIQPEPIKVQVNFNRDKNNEYTS